MKEEEKIVCIDADSIAYICSKDTVNESISSVDSIISDILVSTGASSYILCLSSEPYFRKRIDSSYKIGRKNRVAPKYAQMLLNYLKAEFNPTICSNIEADDLMAYFKHNGPQNLILAAIDKDVLGQVTGTHWNYRKREWITTSEEEANFNLYSQVLSGDAGDSIQGIVGVGKVKAEKILATGKGSYEKSTIDAYKKFYGDGWLHKYYTNYNLIYLLKRKEDFMQWNLELPTANIIKI